MAITLTRRGAVAAPVGLAGLISGWAASAAAPSDIYRVDDPEKILATARAVIEEDSVATLITVDAEGAPRARPVGPWMPDNDFVLWIGTRRTSRKCAQIRANPKAALHFAKDDIENGMAGAWYATFMGVASVHFDDATIAARSPAPEHRGLWPNYPHDYAAIRFETRWVEVAGHGIKGDQANWQPQGVVLPR